jgi:hypothetical protein
MFYINYFLLACVYVYMKINFETSLPLTNLTVKDLKDYRTVAKYMHRKGVLDKANKLQWLNEALPHLDNAIEVYKKYSSITPKPENRNAICIVSTDASMAWCAVANSVLKGYDVFFICDRPFSSQEHLIMLNNKSNIHFVHMDDELVKKMGYTDITAARNGGRKQRRLFNMSNNCGGWEKSLFYFSYLNFHYDNIWFMEDDCLIFNEDPLIDFDKSKNKDVDYIRYHHEPTMERLSNNWALKACRRAVQRSVPNPEDRSFSFAFATRVSHKMLNRIYDFCNQHNQGLFLEVFLATIAKKNNLKLFKIMPIVQSQWGWIDDSGNPRILVGGTPMTRVDNRIIHCTRASAIYHHIKGERRRRYFVRQHIMPLQVVTIINININSKINII